MKIAVIGDPHGIKVPISKLKRVQAILISGDVGKADLARRQFFEKLKNLEYTPSNKEERDAYLETYKSSLDVLRYYSNIARVYFVFGNVEKSDSEVKKISKEIGFKLPLFVQAVKRIKGVKIINNRFVNLDGIRIGGLEYFLNTCWVKNFKPEDYFEELKRANEESKKAKRILIFFGKKKVDVLLCHNPPYGVLDSVGKNAPKKWRGKHAGSKIILDYIKRKHPSYVFCGHIHEGKGTKRVGKTEIFNVGANGDYQILEIK